MQRVRRSTAVAVLPAPPAGSTPGYFAHPDPQGGVPATVPGYEWYNNVQEELVSVVLAAGIALSDTDHTQLLQALRAAGVFTTPPQFDVSTKAATMAAVQRALGSMQSTNAISATTTLAAANAGMLNQLFGSSAYSVTLPAANAVRAGTMFSFSCTNAAGVSVVRAGTDSITASGNVTGITSITLRSGDNLGLVSDGSGAWTVAYGTAALYVSDGPFASSLAASGYQKLPSGLIVQWGSASGTPASGPSAGFYFTSVAITFPLAFPNALRSLQVSANGSTGGMELAQYGSETTTGFDFVFCNTSASTLTNGRWLAVGY